MLASPPLDKVEYLVGAFVIAPRPPWMRQQARNSLLLESPIGHIERLSADAEGGRHVAHRPPLDQVSSEHLVLDLYAVARVEELLRAAKGLVAHALRTRMERTGFAQGRRFGIFWRLARHICQCYYIQHSCRWSRSQ